MNFHASAKPLDTDHELTAVGRKSVYSRIVIDATTALTAAITVSPIVAAVDKYVKFMFDGPINSADAIAMKSSRGECNQE